MITVSWLSQPPRSVFLHQEITKTRVRVVYMPAWEWLQCTCGSHLPLEAPHSRGDALGAASKQRAAQEHRPAQRLAHVLGAGLHLRRDWGRGRRSAGPLPTG